MSLIDLTLNLDDADDSYSILSTPVLLKSFDAEYTGVIHDFSFSSMAGTYIDFPGHIKETDNGFDAVSYPIEKLYRRKATVIRLYRDSDSGGVTAEELQSAMLTDKLETPVLIINALGDKQFDEIDWRTVYLTLDAVEWMCAAGIEVIVSDIYESNDFEGVFLNLFKHDVSTVCFPVNLSELRESTCEVSIFPLKSPQAVQLPCRVIAECS